MRTVTVVENVSLDGVMQAPASPEEDTRGGFTRGGWAATALAAEPPAAEGDAEVLGSGTRLFGDAPLRLSVRRHEAFPSGITVTRWAVER